MEDKIKKVLIVDDEERFIISLIAGLDDYSDQFTTLTAANGRDAVKILKKEEIDLLVTDLRMPKMDGFELLAYVNANYPSIPAIVISAFATPEITERINAIGAFNLLEKPIDFDELAESIIKGLQFVSGGGLIDGISLENFLQLIEMEQKTCLLEVRGGGKQKGLFYFKEGELYDALTEILKGEKAVFEMMGWEKVKIMFKNVPKKQVHKRIDKGLIPLLLEASRRKDEKIADDGNGFSEIDQLFEVDEKKPTSEMENGLHNSAAETVNTEKRAEAVAADTYSNYLKGEEIMGNVQEILEGFKNVDGFMAVGVFSPQGELVAATNASGIKLDELGALANDVLLKAQKTTEIMGVGRGNMVHVQAPKAQVIARCLNEATDFSSTSSGRAHVHMVLVMEQEGNLAMGKMKLESGIQEIAPDFR